MDELRKAVVSGNIQTVNWLLTQPDIISQVKPPPWLSFPSLSAFRSCANHDLTAGEVQRGGHHEATVRSGETWINRYCHEGVAPRLSSPIAIPSPDLFAPVPCIGCGRVDVRREQEDSVTSCSDCGMCLALLLLLPCPRFSSDYRATFSSLFVSLA